MEFYPGLSKSEPGFPNCPVQQNDTLQTELNQPVSEGAGVGLFLNYEMEMSPAIQVEVASETLQKEFYSLVKRWKDETFAISSLTKIYAHPAYQRIIAMGTDGIPFVLKELAKNQGRWFYALKFMAGKDISEGMNNFEDAKDAWLEWGYRNNYI
jgi:hypothetical protein